MAVGRFQPFTQGHLNMINEGDAPCIVYQMIPAGVPDKLKGWKVDKHVVKRDEITNIINYVNNNGQGEVTDHEKEIMKRPFSNELVAKELELVKKNNPNIIDIVYVKNMYDGLNRFNKFCTDHADEWEPQYWMCGDDRVDSYSKEIEHYDELETYFNSGEKIPNILKGKLKCNIGKGRTKGVSGTDVRNAIIQNDKAKFASIMPKGVDSMFDDFKKAFTDFIDKITGFVNERLSLQDFISESLSNTGLKGLTDYLKSLENFSDSDIDELKNIINKHYKRKQLDTKKINKFFSSHGLMELSWGIHNSAPKQFMNLFSDFNNIDKLAEIVDNNGVVSIKDMKNSGNIFTDYCKDWEEEARSIASWTYSRSANSGPFEILLKFIIKEGTTGDIGDVAIKKTETSDSYDEMEVKTSTLTQKGGSGAHAAGQKGGIQFTQAIYRYLNNHLLKNEDTDEQELTKDYAIGRAYFQNKNGVKDFNDKLKAVTTQLTQNDIAKGIVDALCFQYNFISDIHSTTNQLENKQALYDAAVAYLSTKKITQDSGFGYNDLLNFVGCIQLYLYSQVEGFKYLICCLLDKKVTSTSQNNGFYVLFNDCNTTQTDLLNFGIVLHYLKFGALCDTTKQQGRTGKIYVK